MMVLAAAANPAPLPESSETASSACRKQVLSSWMYMEIKTSQKAKKRVYFFLFFVGFKSIVRDSIC